MKLALSTDFGSSHHWERLVAFARSHDVDRLVFWGDSSTAGFTPPFLFPGFPGWLTEAERAQRETIRDKMAAASHLTTKAGMEFWYCFQALMLPNVERARTLAPHLFNEHGEPDMAGESIYRLIDAQIDEVLTIAPDLAGIELWVMECANIVISRLKRQTISIQDICGRIVETVYRKCSRHGLALSVDLHTAGGNRSALEGLLAAARAHPDIIVGADNVIGDFHLHLPFNSHLWRAAVTNPAQVHFDLNGEYWGRNFFPTSALRQYQEHIHEARMMGAACLNGRISTGHDRWSPHFNVLPSRRCFYPHSATASTEEPLSNALEVCCFDTLGGFNAEFFCRCATDEEVDCLDVARAFLRSEFGENVADLALVLADVEGVAARVFFAGQNYFNAQSVLPSPSQARFWALDLQFTAPPGEPIVSRDLPREGRAEFAGWPLPAGLRATGAHALMEEKRQALADAEKLLARAEHSTNGMLPADRSFILRQFEDLALFARAAKTLLDAMVHYYHILADKRDADIPDANRLADMNMEMEKIGQAWLDRQPNDEWKVATRLYEWRKEISRALGRPADHNGNH